YSYSTQSLSASKKVDFALLTDFEEFRFFDCTFPVKDNSLLNNYCVIDWNYKDYVNKFDDLWDYFEKENVRKGSLSGETGKPTLYLNEKKIKSNRISPDKAFLNDLDNEDSGWRITLAKDIKKYQPEFSSEFITQSVQLILDRFIFIKVLSDREIEDEIIEQILGRIKDDSSAHSVFEACKEIFHDLDRTYNGSIFSKRPELDNVKVSNKTLISILKDFLPQNSRYNFKVIPIEILGTIYEQFLGKVVTTTDKRAKIEYKPEVRKAGGVYYTPDYIVNYIVEKTVGEKLKECKTIDDLLEIKICDPACGSGSFLIAAYDALIQWTIQYFKNKKLTREEQKIVYTNSNGEIRLTSKIKRDILKSCIYGVDIDAQAVEVTKMSLSLKALENTTHYEVHNEVTLFHVCVLPPLEGNIKCGNSLLNDKIFHQQELLQVNRNEISKINPFNWDSEFKFIISNGGFDCIIGNPPYIRIQTMREWASLQVDYLNEVYKNYISGNYDIYIIFILKGYSLLKSKGLFGLILPHKFFQGENGIKIRNYISEEKSLNRVVDFTTNQIFENATTYTCLLFLSKEKNETFLYKRFELGDNYKNLNNLHFENKEISLLKKEVWNFNNDVISKVLNKIESQEYSFPEITEKIFKGSSTGNDEVYLLELVNDSKTLVTAYSKILAQKIKIEKKILRPFLYGEDIRRYDEIRTNYFLLFPYNIQEDSNKLISPKEMKENYPNAFDYLKSVQKILSKRKIETDNNNFYKYSAARSLNEYHKPKIMIPDMLVELRVNYDDNGNFFHGPAIHSVVFNDLVKELNTKFFFAILNCKLFWFFISNTSTALRGNAYRLTPEFLNPFKFPKINLNNSKDKSIHDKLVSLVDRIRTLKKELTTEKVEKNIKSIEREIDFVDKEIDSHVYQLYNLTPEEIKIVEGVK
ncbi:MAG TPA: N-6 DNA methylase, partial [Leptospiraceae bacterium]|nr:N-6 DNA methylase [Leptospiraceae bacterium]